MSELRFHVGGVRAGSAARSAEDAASDNPSPARPVVRAGSSARLAEDAKRSGGLPSPAAPILSLRAQGGRVVQRPAPGSSSPAASPAQDVTPGRNIVAAASSAADQPSRIAESHDGARPSPADPLETVAGRLSSFFRTLFHPGT